MPVKFGDFAELFILKFASFQQITLKFGVFTNFKAFFSAMLTDFYSNLDFYPINNWKNRGRVFVMLLWRIIKKIRLHN